MQIKHSVGTLTLASMLAFSLMSPLAAHVSAAPNDGGSSASVPGDCTADQAYQSTTQNSDGSSTKYKKGDNIPQNTTHNAADGNGNVNLLVKYQCDNGKIVVALTMQPAHIHPAAPSVGAVRVP